MIYHQIIIVNPISKYFDWLLFLLDLTRDKPIVFSLHSAIHTTYTQHQSNHSIEVTTKSFTNKPENLLIENIYKMPNHIPSILPSGQNWRKNYFLNISKMILKNSLQTLLFLFVFHLVIWSIDRFDKRAMHTLTSKRNQQHQQQKQHSLFARTH